MKNLLESLTGTHIGLKPTEDDFTGRLISVQTDYMTLCTKTGQQIHYPLKDIRSILTDITEWPNTESLPVTCETFPQTFSSLLLSFIKKMVSINHPDGSFTGILTSISGPYVTLMVSMKKLLYCRIDQIKSVTLYHPCSTKPNIPLFMQKESSKVPSENKSSGNPPSKARKRSFSSKWNAARPVLFNVKNVNSLKRNYSNKKRYLRAV